MPISERKSKFYFGVNNLSPVCRDDVPWMRSKLSSQIWTFLDTRQFGVLHFNFEQALGKGFMLTDESHRKWRSSLIECIRLVASQRGYGRLDGFAVYRNCRRFVQLFRWLISRGLSIEDISATVADGYARYCVSIANDDDGDERLAEYSEYSSLLGQDKTRNSPHQNLEEPTFDSETDSTEDAAQVEFDQEIEHMKKLVGVSLVDKLSPFAHLWEARDLLPFDLQENPLPHGAYFVAKKFITPGSPTELIPLDLGVSMLHGSLRIFQHLVPLVVKAVQASTRQHRESLLVEINREALNVGFNFQIGGRSGFKTKGKMHYIAFNSFTETVIHHAFLVLASTFTLGRPGEFSKLPIGSIAGSAESGFWQARLIEKNYRQVRGSPVHPAIADAVIQLERLFARRREALGSGHLLPKRVVNRKTDPVKVFDSVGLTLLSKLVGCSASQSNDEPDVTSKPFEGEFRLVPRQFRRFGAALWAYRFEMPVASLSVAMNHFDFIVTSSYLNNRTFAGWVEKYTRRLSIDLVIEASQGSRTFAGQQTKRLLRWVNRLRRTVSASSAAPEARIAEMMVEDLHITARPTAWGYCFCPRGEGNLNRANCKIFATFNLSDDGRPDSSASSAGVCCGCRFFMTRADRRPYLEEELARCETVSAQSAIQESQRELANRKVIYLRSVLADLRRDDE